MAASIRRAISTVIALPKLTIAPRPRFDLSWPIRAPRHVAVTAYAFLVCAGLLMSWWAVSKLPKQYTARAYLTRRATGTQPLEALSPAAMQESLISADAVPALVQKALETGTSPERMLADLKQRTKVARVHGEGQEETLCVEVTCREPEAALHLAEYLVTHYVARHQPSERPSEVARQLADLRAEIAAAEADVVRTRAALTAKSTPPTASPRKVHESLVAIRSALTALEKERRRLLQAVPPPTETRLDQAPSLAPMSRPRDEVLARQEIEACLLHRAQLTESLTEQHPAVLALDQRVREIARSAGLSAEVVQASYEQMKPLHGNRGLSPQVQRQLKEVDAEHAALQARQKELEGQSAAVAQWEKTLAAAETEHAAAQERHARLVAQLGKTQQHAAAIEASRQPVVQMVRTDPHVTDSSPHRGLWFVSCTTCWMLALWSIGCFLRKASSR